MAKVHAGLASHGTVFFAHEQSAGKGQRGKTWITEAGANIIMSIVLQPDLLEIKHQFALSACIAVCLHDFFQKYSGNDCRIKWPNDLYWRDRKTGGILIENVILGTAWKYAIVGIGININQVAFPQYLTNL
jgi:BirA family transcriptional regulator, biotin operon repressor / biotin---[acetyl-CoA-carboxylase] ligase